MVGNQADMGIVGREGRREVAGVGFRDGDEGPAVADLLITVALEARPGVGVMEDTDPEVRGFDSDILCSEECCGDGCV